MPSAAAVRVGTSAQAQPCCRAWAPLPVSLSSAATGGAAGYPAFAERPPMTPCASPASVAAATALPSVAVAGHSASVGLAIAGSESGAGRTPLNVTTTAAPTVAAVATLQSVL